MGKLSAASLKILSTVKPDLQKVIMRAAELSPIPFAVVSGNRTVAQQQALWAMGRTVPGYKVTWVDGIKRKSNHQGGGAIDYSLVNKDGHPTNLDPKTWKVSLYKPIADAIKKAAAELKIPIEWMVDLKPKLGDLGHIQLKKK